MRLEKLIQLMDDMRNKQWHITAFPFTYNGVTTTVLVEDIKCFKPRHKDTIAKLTFHDNQNHERILVSEASANSLYVKLTTIRKFFFIEYSEGLSGLLLSFYNHLNSAIPPKYPENLENCEALVVRECLNRGDNNNGMCIFSVKHNPNNGQRSPFNNDKAKRICPDVYEEFYKDNNISFCFRNEKPLSLNVIRRNLGNKQY